MRRTFVSYEYTGQRDAREMLEILDGADNPSRVDRFLKAISRVGVRLDELANMR